jgi:hypothetical protein
MIFKFSYRAERRRFPHVYTGHRFPRCLAKVFEFLTIHLSLEEDDGALETEQKSALSVIYESLQAH